MKYLISVLLVLSLVPAAAETVVCDFRIFTTPLAKLTFEKYGPGRFSDRVRVDYAGSSQMEGLVLDAPNGAELYRFYVGSQLELWIFGAEADRAWNATLYNPEFSPPHDRRQGRCTRD